MKVVHVLRKPCSEPTVAANVLRWGTGALNIDTTRVGYEHTPNPATNPLFRKLAGYKNTNASDAGSSSYSLKDGSGERNPNAGGRWPANLVLQHLDGCVQEGTKEVRVVGCTDKTQHIYGGGFLGGVRTSMANYASKGTETVAAWACAEGCPVAALDEQSGELKSGVAVRHRGVKSGGYGGRLGVLQPGTPDSGFADTGGASRFFRQVKP